VSGGRLRVLVVQAFAENGGSENWLLALLDAASDLDVEVLLLKDGWLRGQLHQRGIPVELWPVGRSPLNLPGPVLRLAARLRRRPPDVVLANVTKAQLVAAPAGLLTGVPTVWAKHDHTYDGLLAVPLGRLSTLVVAAVEELGAPTRRDDVVIVPPPVPSRPPASRAEAVRHLRSLGVPVGDGVPTVVMATRLVPFKGVDDLVQALALPGAEPWRAVVAGDDDHSAPGETERLRALAAALGVADRVHLVGHLAGVAHWLAGFDALALLTRPGGLRAPRMEGYSTVAVEAMRAALPVIAVPGGAVERRLQGGAGVIVPLGDPAALAGALGRLSDAELRRRTGAAGQQIVADYPGPPECADRLVTALRTAAAAGRRARRRARRQARANRRV